jgi:hypothetical protein
MIKALTKMNLVSAGKKLAAAQSIYAVAQSI